MNPLKEMPEVAPDEPPDMAPDEPPDEAPVDASCNEPVEPPEDEPLADPVEASGVGGATRLPTTNPELVIDPVAEPDEEPEAEPDEEPEDPVWFPTLPEDDPEAEPDDPEDGGRIVFPVTAPLPHWTYVTAATPIEATKSLRELAGRGRLISRPPRH